MSFFILCKSWKFLTTKTYPFGSIKKKYMPEKNSKKFSASMVCISICPKLSSILFPFSNLVFWELAFSDSGFRNLGI